MAAIAAIFLAAYSVQVLAQPRGHAKTAIELGTTIAWAVFLVDYLVRFSLAADRLRWFFRHIIDLAIVALPFLRPLRLLRQRWLNHTRLPRSRSCRPRRRSEPRCLRRRRQRTKREA